MRRASISCTSSSSLLGRFFVVLGFVCLKGGLVVNVRAFTTWEDVVGMGAMGGGNTAAQGEGQQRKKVYANGSWYIGSLDGKGRRHGRGAMVFKDGTYEGDWRHGKQTGVGTYVWTSGSRYQGTLRA